jgi:hypothetical protein
MTLLELLLVMVLLGLVLGAGAGVFTTIDTGRRAAAGAVRNVIRSARNSAVAKSSTARVRIDAAAGTIRAEAIELVGTWRFEDERLSGAFGIDGIQRGGELVEHGFIGKGLAFSGSRAAWVEIPVQELASFELSEGFSLECAVRFEGPSGGRLVSLGRAAGLEVGSSGAVRGWMVPSVADSTGRPRPGGRIAADAPPGTLKRGDWQRVRLDYDRRRLRLLVDGVERASALHDAPVWQLEVPLQISDAQMPFSGIVDDLVIGAVSASEEYALPDTVRFAAGAPSVIRFDAGGYLDREVHSEAVSFSLEHEDGALTEIRVGLYGTVE